MRLLIMILLSCLLSACNPPDRKQQASLELMDADRAFSRLSTEAGANKAFETYCALDGVMLLPGRMPVVGKQAVSDLLAGRNDSVFELTWEPLYAMVAGSGDLGYTYGTYTVQYSVPDTSLSGTYASIWVRENGEWRFVLDTGNEGLGE